MDALVESLLAIFSVAIEAQHNNVLFCLLCVAQFGVSSWRWTQDRNFGAVAWSGHLAASIAERKKHLTAKLAEVAEVAEVAEKFSASSAVRLRSLRLNAFDLYRGPLSNLQYNLAEVCSFEQ